MQTLKLLAQSVNKSATSTGSRALAETVEPEAEHLTPPPRSNVMPGWSHWTTFVTTTTYFATAVASTSTGSVPEAAHTFIVVTGPRVGKLAHELQSFLKGKHEKVAVVPAINPAGASASSSSSTTSAPTTTPTTTAPPTTGGKSADMDSGSGEKMYTVGQTGTLWTSAETIALATITVGAPTFSPSATTTTSQYGYFATFTVTVVNIAPASSKDTLSPSSDTFFDQVTGKRYGVGAATGLLSGNSIEVKDTLGTNTVGGSVTLTPGQSETGTVVIDVPSEHGQLVFDGGGKIGGGWSF